MVPEEEVPFRDARIVDVKLEGLHETEAVFLPALIEYMGADRLLLTSDYPHGLAGSGSNPVDTLEALETVSPADKQKIMGLNAAKLFGLQV